jgi:hypothetical protein
MTQYKFAKGPYEINDAGLIYGQVSGDDDEAPFVADVCNSPLEYTEQEKATGKLLAASWEMLELLQEINDAFYVKGTTKALLPVMAKTKSLIRKAKEGA